MAFMRIDPKTKKMLYPKYEDLPLITRLLLERKSKEK